MPRQDYPLISDYGLIGNLHTTALVSRRGSIDYMPFTRFDSPTIFAALLDQEKGGNFSIEPIDGEVRVKQLYLPDTAVLLTRFLSEAGMAELADFMPVKEQEEHCSAVRILRCIKGKLEFRVICKPRFDYARTIPQFRKEGPNSVLMSDGDNFGVRLRSDSALEVKEDCIEAVFTLEEGQEVSFVLDAVNPDEPAPEPGLAYYCNTAFEDTIAFWEEWIGQAKYSGRWEEIVNRSLITLKLLTSHRYGSIVAAATFGLPEAIGGSRNWDYRYSWIRDSAFSMYAFVRMGFREEAGAFIKWIKERCRGLKNAANIQLMYAVDGGSEIDEYTLDHLAGYRDSRPVRVGNAASKQFQLDIYGELIDTVYLFNRHNDSITFDFWVEIREIVNFVCENWQRKGHGIWEVRSETREFLHSKVMSWVAIDRGIRIAEARSFPAPLEKWRQTRDAIYEDIYYNYWNEDKQAFVQYRGADVLDASALLIPLVRLLSPYEPRWQSTLKAIEKELATDTLVYRYRTDNGATDGLEGAEETFSMCSFWYIENLAKAGQIDKARLYFEKMLGYANHLGLFSEMIALNGEQIGNFPQAFTHLALISAAYQLEHVMRGGRQ
ncbi:MAG: glycoside hydrolase family 15 protein [Phaeodactylibacter sp.]|nr:glycoside hydrolase family 15 protein [Phaeodactylibacter sp.]MCB9264220.1 glycoside hydrolase family 15 protein [Lewinellaceae bacterium]MCB9291262.1 glycoside hydrolase family 15 protein [Lewinellaceae bacterium]